MAVLTHRLRGLKPPSTPTVFEALIDSVIEQQISLKAAHSIENRLIRSVGKSLIIEKNTWYSYPTPHIFAHISDSTFRSCGLTIRKEANIYGKFHKAALPAPSIWIASKHILTLESIISEMVKIRGVGRWTAELTILRGLHRPDAFPALLKGQFLCFFFIACRNIYHTYHQKFIRNTIITVGYFFLHCRFFTIKVDSS